MEIHSCSHRGFGADCGWMRESGMLIGYSLTYRDSHDLKSFT